ncbi:hypothetical protein PR202_ga30149 [Eleusine coracana subsp. coracana]|uniref:Uncharacterized protein n=1 Tax=Eleusine coracana subsp. coracana TaxID=191504 RepID=A0AAV5DN54_ELECO|nr:hypothetical protein PR202_ga30149 [Eleusine coracana subsp. coracana]
MGPRCLGTTYARKQSVIPLSADVEKSRIKIQSLHNFSNMQPEMTGPAANADLDIPESVGLYAPQPSSVQRLIEPGWGRRSTRRQTS